MQLTACSLCIARKGSWQHWEATPVSGSLCLQGSADWESFMMSEDKRIFQFGLSQVWVKWLIRSSEGYTRRLQNKKQLSVCIFLCMLWCLLNARHPSKKNPANPEKTCPLQEFCLKLDWCCQPLLYENSLASLIHHDDTRWWWYTSLYHLHQLKSLALFLEPTTLGTQM